MRCDRHRPLSGAYFLVAQARQPVDPSELTVADNTLFFAASDGASGPQLWKGDGSAAGTALVKNVLPGAGTQSLRALTPPAHGCFLLVATEGWWKSDGTAAGTVLIEMGQPYTEQRLYPVQ